MADNQERRNHHRYKVEPGVLTLHHSENHYQIGDILDLNQHGVGVLVEKNNLSSTHSFLADIYWIGAKPLVRGIELQLIGKRRVKPRPEGETVYIGRYSLALREIPNTEQNNFEHCIDRYTIIG